MEGNAGASLGKPASPAHPKGWIEGVSSSDCSGKSPCNGVQTMLLVLVKSVYITCLNVGYYSVYVKYQHR